MLGAVNAGTALASRCDLVQKREQVRIYCGQCAGDMCLLQKGGVLGSPAPILNFIYFIDLRERDIDLLLRPSAHSLVGSCVWSGGPTLNPGASGVAPTS